MNATSVAIYLCESEATTTTHDWVNKIMPLMLR